MTTHGLQVPEFPRRSFLMGGLSVAALAGLSACGGGKGSNGGGSASGEEYLPGSAELKVQLGPEIEGVLYPDGYIGPKARTFEKFSDGSKTYRIVARSFPNQNVANDNTFSKHLEKATGVKVTYDIVPVGDDGAPKINAMIASGDLPDAFMTGPLWMGGFSRSQIWAYGQQGLFQPVDKLVDEYAPELISLFAQFPELRKVMTAPDGKLYMFPAVNQCYHCKSSEQRTWIHAPSAEKVGADINSVNTLEDFEALLREVKAAGLIPYTGNIDYPPLALLEMAYLNIGTSRLRRQSGGAISYTPVEDAYRQVLITAHRLVKEGLIDPNGFSQTEDQLKRLQMDPAGPRAAIVPGGSQGSFVDVKYEPNALWQKFQPLKPVTGPDGSAHAAWDYTPGEIVGLILTKNTQNPTELIRWADYQTSLVSTLSMRLGASDTNWDWAKKGDTGIDGRQAVYKKTEPAKDNDIWYEMGPYNLVMDVRHGEAVDDLTSIEPSLYRAGKLYEPFASPEGEYFSEPFFTTSQAAQVGEQRVNIDNAFLQGRANLALGKSDPNNDADWDAFVNSIKGAGLDQYLQILTEADQAR